MAWMLLFLIANLVCAFWNYNTSHYLTMTLNTFAAGFLSCGIMAKYDEKESEAGR